MGVLVEVNCKTGFAARSPTLRNFAHEIALQVAAAAPRYVRDEEIPAEKILEEARKAKARAREERKPEAVIPRIVSGFLEKYRNQTVLLRQASIRDNSLSVTQLLSQASAALHENIVIRRVAHWESGEKLSL